MHELPSPWTVDYWKTEIAAGRAPESIRPGVFNNLPQVGLAWEAAFELRDWPAAKRIAEDWAPYVNPNTTENRSPWVQRELLFFLRGKTEGKWLDLLLQARARMTWEHEKSFLACAFEEIHAQLDLNDQEGLPRLFEVVPKLLANGASMNDGSALLADALPRLRAQVVERAPVHLEKWDAAVEHMQQALEIDGEVNAVEIRVEDALAKQDLPALRTLIPKFVALPAPRRSISPLGIALQRHERSPGPDGYPIHEVVEALLQAGLPPREVDDDGHPPLSLVLEHPCAPSDMARLVSACLRAGADPNQCNEQAWRASGAQCALDTPLHTCSLREDAPVGLLLAGGARIDARDDRSMTPLLYACREGNLGTMKALLSAGADVHAQNDDGADAAFEYLDNMLREEKDFQLSAEAMANGIQALVEAGADMLSECQSRTGWKGLFSYQESSPHLAAKTAECMALLLDRKVALPWRQINDIALPYASAAPMRALLAERWLNLETVVPASRATPRRM